MSILIQLVFLIQLFLYLDNRYKQLLKDIGNDLSLVLGQNIHSGENQEK
jgi:hypothetical protein